MRVLVVGAAVSGMAAAELARRLGHSVAIYDKNPATSADILSAGFGAIVGAWDVTTLSGIDLVVASPGVPERSEPFTHAHEMGIPVWSEVEFAWRELACPTVAVTGTNGKTTVTTLVAEMLGRSRPSTVAAGNIGDPLSDVVGKDVSGVVIEVSSFQLRFTELFRPDVAVVTNVAPDHLDWHGSFERYLAAKAEIVARQRAEDVLVIDADDEGARRIAALAPSKVVEVSGTRRLAGGGIQGDRLWVGEESIGLDRLRVADSAFLADLAIAGAATVAAGGVHADVFAIASSFEPGAHRRSVVGRVGDVTFVDDSKATNPHAALAAIRAYPSVVLIAGGLAKGLDIRPLALEPNLHAVIAIGEAADQLLEAAPDITSRAGDMTDAVARALEHARPGDTVLLAPGCASFDMFASYAARGDSFAAAVRSLADQEASR